MTLYSKLAQVDAKIGLIETKLGLPMRRSLLVRQIVHNHTAKTQTITDTLITPKPYITSVAPALVNLQVGAEGVDQVFITSADLQVEIPRTYSKEFFVKQGANKSMFVVDPPLTPQGAIAYVNPVTKTINADFYKLIYLKDSDPVRWLLVLRKEVDRR